MGYASDINNPSAQNAPPRNARRSFSRSITHTLMAALASFLLIRLLLEIIQRLRAHRASWAGIPTEIELGSLEEQPPLAAPQIEEYLEPETTFVLPSEIIDQVEISYEVASESILEGEISFGLVPAAIDSTSIPDPYLTVPTNLLVESFEPKYQFNWQNPTLVKDIYPYRIEKLVDFLVFYSEIELLKEYRSKGIADPAIQAKIRQSESKLRQARQEVVAKLSKAIEDHKQSDTYFARITGRDEINLRDKQIYYLDRESQRLGEKLDDLKDRKTTLLNRVDWYPEGDYHQDVWRERANALNPEIEALSTELSSVKALLELYEQEAQLPDIETQQVTIEDAVRWEIRDRRQQWVKKSQEELLAAIINGWFRRNPDRFPEWLIYMVIHFSGMRYMSAHGTWAEPRFLLELLAREDIDSEINDYDPGKLSSACNQAIQELQGEVKSLSNDPKQKSIHTLIHRLGNQSVQKRALTEYRTAKTLDEIQKLPDDNACLSRLIQLKEQKEARGDPMPEWVWTEIVKYTPLRLETDDPDWEAYSPERWKWTNTHWREILSTWQNNDITAWRKKHRESLDLIVTRAVCNEIAEHIQDLRGLTPCAGLTAKPSWYLRQAEKNPRAYFVQAPSEEDFKTGASILWLGWVDRPPNAWQVALPLPGFNFPGQTSNPNHEVSRQKQRKQGKSEKKIRKIIANRKTNSGSSKSYLRWTHEAIVVDVVDMVDGKYVLTFETGKIGVILRRLSDLRANPMVFVGYIPPAPSLPDELDINLVEMLRWDRILPEANLPKRARPRTKVNS